MSKHDDTLLEWQEKEALAEQSVPLIGRLFREKGVITLVYNQPLMHRSPSQLLKHHLYVRKVENEALSIKDTVPLLEEMDRLPLNPARIDIGKLGVMWNRAGQPDVKNFLRKELAGALKGESEKKKPRDVVLYGFGRIGRLVARLLVERTGQRDGMRLSGIVVRKPKGADLHKRAELLRRDSVHGRFWGIVDENESENAIVANGHHAKLIYANKPQDLDYTAYGIENAIICDNTGIWRDEQALSGHLEGKGAGKVLLTAPGKGEVRNIVFGVNDDEVLTDDRILSAASCTTNAITPVLKSIHERYGIKSGHLETVHSYTNDQNLIDNFHSADRRGRSAALNMVLTSTGAAKAVAKAYAPLDGKLTGNAIRVPTPNVSMAILMLALENEVTRHDLNEHLRNASLHSALQKQIGYSVSDEVASSDIVGARHTGIVDSKATIADGHRIVLYVWYDNEFGYSMQVVRLLQKMAGIQYETYPKEEGCAV
ncbi:MAG: glyceraldehyde-3-phosphate dehydrogenase [Deltaproteobacteria bacterium]|nr:glyceraldehyde-3-phosphate dehydrogenase [Deltaproteobacteria bacterium]